jgi:hypothetical protein
MAFLGGREFCLIGASTLVKRYSFQLFGFAGGIYDVDTGWCGLERGTMTVVS